MDDKVIREIRIDPIVPTQSVLISTVRGKRPRQDESPLSRDVRNHVKTCPFCRGNEHHTPPASFQVPSSGDWSIRIVENLYPILDDDPLIPELPPGMQQAIEGYGYHEVIIDHPNHGIAIHQMSEQHLTLLLGVYRDRMHTLYKSDLRIRYVLVFKNFGKAAGGSMPHSHSQIIAMPIVPHNVQNEVLCSQAFYQKTGTCIFCTLVDEALSLETTTYNRESGEIRQNYKTVKYVIEQGKKFIAIKPFASRYEWEVHILPIKHQSNFLEINPEDLDDLARVLRRTMTRLKAVVGEVQYNYFIHSVPHVKNSSEFAHSYHWHIEICPRTSIPSGFELGSGLFVNTISPENAASKLRQAILREGSYFQDKKNL
jgi:UDPglucose--hexose-1-phosphate uridylyltransferase